jgi:formylglycine-generating enzyme required for sulfatase activity
VKNIEDEDRAFRGGSWDRASSWCRASNRDRFAPDDRDYYLGFRVVHRKKKP